MFAEELTPRFISGLILLALNPVFGWGSIAVFVFLAKKTNKKIYYLAGSVFYFISWLMAFLGIYLAGPEGVELTKKMYAKHGIEFLAVLVIVSAWVVLFFFMKRKNATGADTAGRVN